MNKQTLQPQERLVGLPYIMSKLDCSRSTIQRLRKNGNFPEPDVKATVSGASNKWFISTINKYFNSLKTVGEV